MNLVDANVDSAQVLGERAIEHADATIDKIFQLLPPDDDEAEELRSELRRSLIIDAISVVAQPEEAQYPDLQGMTERFWFDVWYDYFDPTCEVVSRVKLLYLCELAMTVHSIEERQSIALWFASQFDDDPEYIVRKSFNPETGICESRTYRTLESVMCEYLGVDEESI